VSALENVQHRIRGSLETGYGERRGEVVSIRINLPIIDEDIIETLDGTDLIVKNANNRWEWTQTAADFVAVLQSTNSRSGVTDGT
jgi:hypothetical protein